jgi:toxin secretion/phage lysis holin
MKDYIIDIIRGGAIVIGACVGSMLGSVDGLLYTLIAFVVIDYFTGVTLAIANHQLNSAVGFKGIARKVLIFALVIVANMLDVNVLGGSGMARTAVIFFYLANEGLSIMENAAKLGLPLPEKLKDILEQLKEGSNDNNKKTPSEADK